ALPASREDDLPPVEIADIERDLDGVRSCYHEWVQHNHATLEPTDDRWWTERIFDDDGEESFGAVVVRDAGTVTGFATFKHVKDPMFPDKAGPGRLSVGEGEVTVDPVSPAEAARSPRPIPVGAFSAMFTGFLRVADAVRLGILDRDDPATPALARLLSGPDPW